ncbi:glycosyltransferase [Comamonas sp. A7-5]|uniref:glycosyltransferase family protein n=1 Tax=Comamonas sp. A7-5 TaxID=673549 RepID=UPI0031D4C3AE
MNELLTKKAFSAYLNGNYETSLKLYEKLSNIFGEQLFKYNLDLCKKNIALKGKRKKSIKALTLLDEFSETCFSPDLDLERLDRKNWKEQIESGDFDFLFSESAWRGNAETWSYALTKFHGKHGSDLKAALDFCKEKGIPTVFWNKEDPVNFDVFIEAAKYFDFVFTTDEGCIPRYKNELGHDRVFVLPFAAQPTLHNPVINKDRISKVAFAGSWNGTKYPARARWLETMFDYPMENGILDIYDRYASSHDAKLKFPAEYNSAVIEAVPYSEISERVYKKYSLMINVNSVEDSPTMVARRIYELSACGTPIISNPSPAFKGKFSDIVEVVNSKNDAAEKIEYILNNEMNALSRGVKAIRLVHTHHTYRHRLVEIFNKIGLRSSLKVEADGISVIIVSKRPHFLQQISKLMNEQVAKKIQIIFVMHGEGFDELEIRNAFSSRFELKILNVPSENTVLADGLNLALENADMPIVAKIDDDDYYGPSYISDALLALKYSDAGVVGKGSYFCYVESINKTGIRFPGKHYRMVKRVHGGTLVWDRRRTGDIQFEKVRQGTDSLFIKSVLEKKVKILSTDPFNFVHMRYSDSAQHTWKIEDDEFISKLHNLKEGLDFSGIYI